MNGAAILMVLTSTVMHAGWNLLAQRGHSQVAFFRRMLVLIAIAGLVPWTLGQWFVDPLAPKVWACAVSAGVCSGIYCLGLALAYEQAEFTVVYPVARSLPILALGIIDVLRSRHPTLLGWVGMSFVACGCFAAPLRAWSDFAWSRYANRASLAMLLASLGTVGYSLIDKIAAEAIQQGPASAAVYGYVLFVVIWVTFAGTLRLSRRPGSPSVLPAWPTAGLGAVLCFCAYWLVLWAYQITERVSYVVAFRQFSIVIGVGLAVLLLKEHPSTLRVLATVLITIGLVMIAVQR
jgi:drug/metabolite transporter (DMT)-like permease